MFTCSRSQDNIVATTTSQLLITFNICHGFLACKMDIVNHDKINTRCNLTNKNHSKCINVWFFMFECKNIILYYKSIMCLHDNVSNILWENVEQFLHEK
jgi:hypothetical protein